MYYIGIDLGGTNIKGALVSETGEIAREVSRPTRVELGAEAVCDGIAAVITELSSGGPDLARRRRARLPGNGGRRDRLRALCEQPRLEEL